jgi:hypothetical protein
MFASEHIHEFTIELVPGKKWYQYRFFSVHMFFEICIPERDDIFLHHFFISLLFDRLHDLQAFLPVVVMLVPENL